MQKINIALRTMCTHIRTYTSRWVMAPGAKCSLPHTFLHIFFSHVNTRSEIKNNANGHSVVLNEFPFVQIKHNSVCIASQMPIRESRESKRMKKKRSKKFEFMCVFGMFMSMFRVQFFSCAWLWSAIIYIYSNVWIKRLGPPWVRPSDAYERK